MLPENNTYGPWPISGSYALLLANLRLVLTRNSTGEIDIMEARGNDASYPDQFVYPKTFITARPTDLLLRQGQQLRPRIAQLGSPHMDQ